jgi:hypothetical protein
LKARGCPTPRDLSGNPERGRARVARPQLADEFTVAVIIVLIEVWDIRHPDIREHLLECRLTNGSRLVGDIGHFPLDPIAIEPEAIGTEATILELDEEGPRPDGGRPQLIIRAINNRWRIVDRSCHDPRCLRALPGINHRLDRCLQVIREIEESQESMDPNKLT